MPTCNDCGQYYISRELNCPSCSKNQEYIISESPLIKNITDKLFNSQKMTNSFEYTPVNPPPPPPKSSITEGYTMDSNLNSINLPSQNEGFTIYRRALILVFDEETLELMIQIPWIKRISSSILEVKFQKEFNSNQTFSSLIEIVLRMKIQFISPDNELIENFLGNGLIQEEISLKISPAYLVLKNSPINISWYNFITSNNKLNKKIYYLIRNGDLDNKHYANFTLDNVEDLFVSFIMKILNITTNTTEISILTDSNLPIILNNKLMSNIPDITFDNRLNLDITLEISYCMGHGGLIEKDSLIKNRNRCKICKGELCTFCMKAFFMCPGSITTNDIHKFMK